MSVLRSFTLTDYGLLRRLTKKAVFLNNYFQLTQGLGASLRGALLSPLSAFTGIHTFTSLAQGNSHAVFAQAFHASGSSLAYCLLLAPSTAMDSVALPELLDGLTRQIGVRGAFSLVAEIEEVQPAFKTLRHNGFAIFARQQVWKLTKAPHPSASVGWRPALERDLFGVHLLRKALVPGQVQQIEMETTEPPDGYVLRQDGEIVAYAEVRRGPRGIWLLPFVSLDAEPFDTAMADLIAKLRPRPGRPVYVCLRSYQDWLQRSLEDLGAAAGPRQVVMARRTSLPLAAEDARRVPVPARRAEASTPMRVPEPQARYADPVMEP